MTIADLKKLSKEEFLKTTGLDETVYNALQNSKSGFIHVTREKDGLVQKGYTSAFGEGISCRMDNMSSWWITSVIKKINWEDKYFDTQNSRYYFDFNED